MIKADWINTTRRRSVPTLEEMRIARERRAAVLRDIIERGETEHPGVSLAALSHSWQLYSVASVSAMHDDKARRRVAKEWMTEELRWAGSPVE